MNHGKAEVRSVLLLHVPLHVLQRSHDREVQALRPSSDRLSRELLTMTAVIPVPEQVMCSCKCEPCRLSRSRGLERTWHCGAESLGCRAL